VGFLADGDTGLHAFIADGVLKVSYFGRPATIEDQTYWVWDKSARQGTGFDVKIDGLDSTRGKFQFIATAHGGLSYRIERNGSRRNFNAGSWGDDGLSVPRKSFSTSTTNFSFRLVYSPKRKTLQAFFDRNGPIGGVKWELLQTVKNPNFPRNVPILIMFVYNNNETGQALNGSQVQADNFLAR